MIINSYAQTGSSLDNSGSVKYDWSRSTSPYPLPSKVHTVYNRWGMLSQPPSPPTAKSRVGRLTNRGSLHMVNNSLFPRHYRRERDCLPLAPVARFSPTIRTSAPPAAPHFSYVTPVCCCSPVVTSLPLLFSYHYWLIPFAGMFHLTSFSSYYFSIILSLFFCLKIDVSLWYKLLTKVRIDHLQSRHDYTRYFKGKICSLGKLERQQSAVTKVNIT